MTLAHGHMLDCARKSDIFCINKHRPVRFRGWEPGMSHVENELSSQPECWKRAAELAVQHKDALPAPGERVAVVGCGTSFFMAQAVAALRERRGTGRDRRLRRLRIPRGTLLRPGRRADPLRHHHRGARPARGGARPGPYHRHHGRPEHAGHAGRRRHRRARLRRRGVGRPDPLRHHRPHPAARPPRAAHRAGRRRRPHRTGRTAARRPGRTAPSSPSSAAAGPTASPRKPR